ncbi:nitroreductase family protein [Desulfovibrio sp.]|uniref:nitroreductase family protein n=1 Tax=Desulfovibrio sp. TaxID=885 RepID=UPI0023CD46F3|nr:nitroreductase family protein [Desulfovibrio sp.]MDE7240499.1 nitroreductase family protein [Desulfovibrio sp.]
MPVSPSDFHELVLAARTCRRFVEDEPLTMDDLDWLVDCARLTPSARNAQVLRFILVTKGQVLDELFKLTRWAGALKEGGTPKPGERPTAFIAILAPKEGAPLAPYDAGIASETIQLAAATRGWGCCIIYSVNRKDAAPLLKVPADMDIPLALGLGVAKEERAIAEMPADGSFNYWRDAQGVHHVPKRGLAELVIGRFGA